MILLTCLVLAATPYADPLGRFTLTLPDGWEPTTLGPGPAAVASETTAFRRRSDELLANLAVFVLPAPPGVSAASLAQASGRASARTPGYELVSEGPSKLGSLPAFRRRYLARVDEEGKWRKMVEERLALSDGHALIVHAETLAESFATFEADFDAIFASFAAPSEASGTGDALVDSPLVGRWQMKGSDAILDLRADGTFELGGTHGTYSISGGELRMTARGSGTERFGWRMEGGELVIEGPTLGAPIVYRRLPVRAARPDPEPRPRGGRPSGQP